MKSLYMALNIENKGEPVCILKSSKVAKPIQISVCSKVKELQHPFYELALDDEDDDEEFQIVPNSKQERDILYIIGKSGSGKSYYAMQYAKEYKKRHPHNPIYVFSEKPKDTESLDKIGEIHRIKIGKNLLETDSDDEDDEPKKKWDRTKTHKNVIKQFEAEAKQNAKTPSEENESSGGLLNYKDFENSLVIFDDVDAIMNKKIKEAVYGLLNQMCNMGRSKHISVIMTSHKGASRKETEIILREAHMITVFPRKVPPGDLDYILETYFGLNKEGIEDVKSIRNSRWVTLINQTYPSVAVSQKEVWIPDEKGRH